MNAISSDSDSSEDEENSGNKENNEDKKQQTGEKETEEEMDVDPGLSLWIVSFIKTKYSTRVLQDSSPIFLGEVTGLIVKLKNSSFSPIFSSFSSFYYRQFLSTF